MLAMKEIEGKWFLGDYNRTTGNFKATCEEESFESARDNLLYTYQSWLIINDNAEVIEHG